ncbi:MAG: DUF1289 domain-containing protein [Alphaproteobacteria bacterium]
MTDTVWARVEVDSPCVKICVIHPQERLCLGCYRTMEEIATWSRLTSEDRRAVIEALPSRALKLVRRRGGRAARLER